MGMKGKTILQPSVIATAGLLYAQDLPRRGKEVYLRCQTENVQRKNNIAEAGKPYAFFVR